MDPLLIEIVRRAVKALDKPRSILDYAVSPVVPVAAAPAR
jgi:hypothetical protein